MKQQKRVAIYARVSTFDKGQNPETQLVQLRAYAKNREFTVEHELVDCASGKKEDKCDRLVDIYPPIFIPVRYLSVAVEPELVV